MPHPNEEYVGDGVYVQFDGADLRLFTERVEGVDEIFIEPIAFKSLLRFLCKLRDEKKLSADAWGIAGVQ